MYAENIDLQWIKDLGKPSALFNQLRLARQKALFSEEQKNQAIQFAKEALEKALPIFQQYGLQKAVEVTTTLLDYVRKEPSPMTQAAAVSTADAQPPAITSPAAVPSAESDEQMRDVRLAYAVLAALEKLSPKTAGWTTHSLTTALAKLGHKSLVDLLVPENGQLTVENKDNKRALNPATMARIKGFLEKISGLNQSKFDHARHAALDTVANISNPSQLPPLAQAIYTRLTGNQITAAAAQPGEVAPAAAPQPPPSATAEAEPSAVVAPAPDAPPAAEAPAADAAAGAADQVPPAGEQTQPPPAANGGAEAAPAAAEPPAVDAGAGTAPASAEPTAAEQGQPTPGEEPPAQNQQQPPAQGEELPPPTATGEGIRTPEQVVAFWNTIADADDDRSDAFGLAASETQVAIVEDQDRKKITLTKGQLSTSFYDDGRKLTFGDVNGNFNRELDAKAAAYAILNDERFANGATIESPTAEFVTAVKAELSRQLGNNVERDTFEASESGKKIVFKRPSGYSSAARRPTPRQAVPSVAPAPGQRAAA